jgi:hypothetical protein
MKKICCTIPDSFRHYCFLLVAGFLFCPDISLSQGLYNQSLIHINNVNVYVEGEINNTGVLINDGLIGFTKDWDSEGTYRGNGSLLAYGNAPQKIAHYNQKVQSLMINGWGTKFIKGKINIKDAFHLLQGIVQVPDQDVLSLQDKAVIFGGSTESYVEGAITVEGTGYKFFPVGKNGTYAPMELLNVKGKSAKYSIEVFENAPVISVDNAIVKNGLYWQRRDLGGDFEGSAVAIDFDRSHFNDINKIIMVVGTDWENPFTSITDLEHSLETDQLTTRTDVVSPVIMLGEISDNWAEADFYFSTALSPNASNPDNRKVKVFGERLDGAGFHFQVFNRWGSVVYESTSLESMSRNGWDGRSANGDDLVSGAYPYRLTAFDKTGKRFEKKGVISIIR